MEVHEAGAEAVPAQVVEIRPAPEALSAATRLPSFQRDPAGMKAGAAVVAETPAEAVATAPVDGTEAPVLHFRSLRCDAAQPIEAIFRPGIAVAVAARIRADSRAVVAATERLRATAAMEMVTETVAAETTAARESSRPP